MRRSLALALSSCVMLTGCPTEAGNPPVAVQARSGDPSIATFRSDGAGVRVTELWIADGSLRLVTGDLCDRVGPALVSGIRGDIASALAAGGLAPGEICGVFVSLEASDESSAETPTALVARSVLVIGTRLDGRPFEVTSAESFGIDVLSTTGPVVLTEEGTVLALDVVPLLAAVDLDAVALDVDGVARVGPTREAAAAARFADALIASLALYDDLDGNGALDATEVAAGPLATSHGP